ncbi:MAG: hypothetical protein QW348_08790 [Ignisphaera sp.]
MPSLMDGRDNWGLFQSREVQSLRDHVYSYASKAVPGAMHILNVLCKSATGLDAMSLLFTSPSRLYQIVLSFYKNTFTADTMFKTLFLNPIARHIKSVDVDEMLYLVKTGRDDEFLKLIEKYLKP